MRKIKICRIKIRRTISMLMVIAFMGVLYPTECSERVPRKDWNFIVYLSANNDLNRYALRNIAQMVQVGSNRNVNILVQVDTYGKREVNRYFIEKDNAVFVERISDDSTAISGTPESLFDFARWAITSYPSRHTALILWDHGSGIIDPCRTRGGTDKIYLHDLFEMNKKTGLIDLGSLENRGISFNDFDGTYLNNQDLKRTLGAISRDLLGGKKIDIVGMDACLMAMLEVGSQIKDSTHYLVASEEIEAGNGWNYRYVLSEFERTRLTPKEFAIRMVRSYDLEYKNQYGRYTQSAIDLSKITALETNLDLLAKDIIRLLVGREGDVLLENLNIIRNSLDLTTSFANRHYVDLHHFYSSLLSSIEKCEDLIERVSGFNKPIVLRLRKLLSEGMTLILSAVLDNACSESLHKAKGISFYFPINIIHASYGATEFAKNNSWLTFLRIMTRISSGTVSK